MQCSNESCISETKHPSAAPAGSFQGCCRNTKSNKSSFTVSTLTLKTSRDFGALLANLITKHLDNFLFQSYCNCPELLSKPVKYTLIKCPLFFFFAVRLLRFFNINQPKFSKSSNCKISPIIFKWNIYFFFWLPGRVPYFLCVMKKQIHQMTERKHQLQWFILAQEWACTKQKKRKRFLEIYFIATKTYHSQ